MQKCNELTRWVDVIHEQVPPNYTSHAWKHSRVYAYRGEDPTTMCGFILLRERHGPYDGTIIKQDLKTFLNRCCIDIVFTEIREDKISFIATERNNVIVDSNKTLIPFFCGDPSTEPQAKKLTEVSHYTEATSAIKILTDNIFIGKSLSRYKSEMDFVTNENSRRLDFISCFSTNLTPDGLMWERFADKHRGCKIDFVFKHTLADAFPLNCPVKCKDEHGTQYEISSSFNHVDGTLPHVFFTVHYSLAQYTSDLSNKAILHVCDSGQVEDFTISPYVGRSVNNSFEYQNEVRILLQLNSFYRSEIPHIQKVELPFDLSEIEKIVLTIGKNATDLARQKIENEFGGSPLIMIENEII